MGKYDVKRAVIPCAGKGTRFLPVTKGTPKEMCPIVDKPTLDYIVDECIDGGITNILIILSEGKDDIRRYYHNDVDYEKELIEKGKTEFASIIHNVANKANFYFAMQHELLGLGHAVLQAKEFIKNENFIVCCGDDICTYEGDAPSKQLIEAFKKTNGHTIVGGQKVKHEMISKYGCMDINRKESARLYSLKGIVEKPNIEEAPSDLASLGKWVFNSKIFDYIEKTPKGKGGEIQLTDAIALMIKDEPVYFYDFVGKRYDCGDKLGYLKAIVDVALKRDDLKDSFKEFLKEKDFR
ncbi:MAG: UTP--glucose-1-phosphate uridylyltransferase [Mollicutes bacterium]|nr:UTP--glucose-1-phosphate uridylyltransferase [Mollicutes bacterium]